MCMKIKMIRWCMIMNKMKMIIIMIMLCTVSYQMYMGTVDGWVRYMNGSPVENANVTALVSGCSVSCTGWSLTDPNGYYLIDNLNMNPGDNVNVDVVKGLYTGSGNGIANSASVARVNVTVCSPPSNPVLVDQVDISHNYVDLTWTSGSDPDGYPTHDIYKFNYGLETDPASPPQHESGLVTGSYLWQVKTCNSRCCSSWSNDTFNVVPPSQPVLVHQGDTHNDNVTLNWTSGSDPEGQPTYDDFIFDSSVTVNVTHPQNVTNLSFGSHTWGARTCNQYFCSGWATDSFNRMDGAPSIPNLNPIPDGNYSCVNLTWTSGIDPNGDSTYDQLAYGPVLVFSYANYTNATSPYEICNVSGTYKWAVRTCDEFGLCSSWNTSHFTSSNCPPCPPCPNGTSTRTETIIKNNNVVFVVMMPSLVVSGKPFEVNVNLKNFGDQPIHNIHVYFEPDHGLININDIYLSTLSQGSSVVLTSDGVGSNVSSISNEVVTVSIGGETSSGAFTTSLTTNIDVLPIINEYNNATCENDSDCPYNMICNDRICIPLHCPGGMYILNHSCVVMPECHSDYDCEDAFMCDNGSCVMINCSCGYVTGHVCHHYECCFDSDCGVGYLCSEHECIPAPSNESEYVNYTKEILETIETWSDYLNDTDRKKIMQYVERVKQKLNNGENHNAYKLAKEGMKELSRMNKDNLEMLKHKLFPWFEVILILIGIAVLLYLYYHMYHHKGKLRRFLHE